jgi:hypothetical protein
MGMMKRFAEEVSIEMGFDGELNDVVLEEASRRLHLEDNPHQQNLMKNRVIVMKAQYWDFVTSDKPCEIKEP